MKNRKADGAANKLRVNYLFSGFYNDKGELEGGFKPVPNILFSANSLVPNIAGGKFNKIEEKILPWCSNHIGIINELKIDFETGHRSRALTKGMNRGKQELYFPIEDDYAYLYSVSGDKWIDALDGNSKDIFSGLGLDKPLSFERKTVKYNDLEKPLSDKELSKKLLLTESELKTVLSELRNAINKNKVINKDYDFELIYKAWYLNQTKDDIFHGYVIRQSRFLVLFFSFEIGTDSNIVVWHNSFKKKYTLKVYSNKNGNFVSVLRLPKKELTDGFYKIEIKPDNVNNFGEQFKESSTFSFYEKVRFNIKNLAGEYAIVNCDPISVEESLFKQHSNQFLHLIQDSLKKEESENKSTTIKNITHDIKTRKIWMDNVRGILDAEKQRGQIKLLGEIISETLDAMKVEKSVTDFVDLAFNVVDFKYKSFDDLKKTLKKFKSAELAGDSLKNLLRTSDFIIKDIWKKPAEETAESLGEYLFSKYKLPKAYLERSLNFLDYASPALGVTLNIFDVADTSQNFFYKDIQNIQQKHKQCHQVFEDYHKHIAVLSDKQSSDNQNTFEPGQSGDIHFTVLFESNRSDIQTEQCHLLKHEIHSPSEQAHKTSSNTQTHELNGEAALHALVQFLQAHPRVNFHLSGYTDPVGADEDNQSLSLARANALKTLLVNDFGIDTQRITCLGLGENKVIYNQNNEVDYSASRRVETTIAFLGTMEYHPSREGMASLEKARHATVLAKQEHAQEFANLVQKSWDLILSVGSVTPHGRLVSAILVGYDIVKNALALADDVFFDHFVQQEIAQYQQLKSYHSSAIANQILLRDVFETEKENAHLLYLQTQFRVRAEALNGLMGLITRAAIGADSEADYLERFKKYKIRQYIDNFLLNDQWLFPLKKSLPLTMDEYWTYAVNSHGLISDENYSWFGFNKDFRLDSTTNKKTLNFLENLFLLSYQNEEAKKQVVDALFNITDFAQHAYSYATSNVAEHQKANFQSCFPVHYLASDSIEDLATHFTTNLDYLDTDVYEHTMLYIRPKESSDDTDWMTIAQWHKKYPGRAISPLDPVRLLIVLNDENVKKHDTLPASIQLYRRDWRNISGPVYKTLLRPLVQSELLNHELKYKGQTGCVFYPFYQFNQLTFYGTKPLSTETRLFFSNLHLSHRVPRRFDGSEESREAWHYWQHGGLKDMCYEFTIRIGSDEGNRQPIAIDYSNDPDDGEYTVSMDVVDSSYYQQSHRGRRINPYYNGGWKEDALFLYTPFLLSRSQEEVTPVLFDRDSAHIMVMIRIGGEQGEYVSPDELFIREINNSYYQSMGMSGYSSDLFIRSFDWDTPVEFVFVASTHSLDFKAYKNAHKNWRKLPFSARLFETNGLDCEGPGFSTTMNYIGRLKREGGLLSSQWRYQSDKDVSNRPGYKPVIKLLQAQDDKASYIAGYHGDIFKDDNRYLFAAHYRCSYQNLTGMMIDSIRPFGRDIKIGTKRKLNRRSNVKPYFSFAFGEVKTGDGSIDQSRIENSGFLTTEFHFQVPDSYVNNAPWVKLPPDSDEQIQKARELQKDTLLTQWLDKSEQEQNEAIKYWIETDTRSIYQQGTARAFV